MPSTYPISYSEGFYERESVGPESSGLYAHPGILQCLGKGELEMEWLTLRDANFLRSITQLTKILCEHE